MALSARDLVFPRGVIKPSQYPGEILYRTALEDAEGIVDLWLEQAALLTDDPKAQQAFVYARHYSTQAEAKAEEYSSWSEGGISRSRNAASIIYFQRLAGAQQLLFERATGTAFPRPQEDSGTTQIEGTF